MDQQIQKHIASLPASEQLEIADFIYQSLASSGDLLTEEQIEETKRRSRQVDENPESLLTRDEVWAEVDRLRNEREN
jgi:putative addiction module component (TIGR02574 family)